MSTHDNNNDSKSGGFMALDPIEQRLCEDNPRIRSEIKFHALALIICTLSFGTAVFNVAFSLLDYPFGAAALFGAGAALGLYLIDKHYLVQSRGAYRNIRSRVLKVRVLSMLVISMSFAMLAVPTFRADIDRVHSEEIAKRAEALRNSPRYQAALAAAQNEVAQAAAAVGRRDELRQSLTDLEAAAAQQRTEERHECEGNTTGAVKRRAGCGSRARGHAAEAERLEKEAAAKSKELTGIGDPDTRLATARKAANDLNNAIQEEAAKSVQGASRKLDAVFTLLSHSPSAALAILFWVCVGFVPDVLMLVAQSQSVNEQHFANARRIQGENIEAQLVRLRSDLRRKAADGLAPIEVRLATPPRLATTTTTATDGGHRPAPGSAPQEAA